MDQLAIRRRGKGRPRTRPGAALGDKAYSSAANRTYLRKRVSRRSSRSSKTRRNTAAAVAAMAAGRLPSTPDSTRPQHRRTLLWQAQAVPGGRDPL